MSAVAEVVFARDPALQQLADIMAKYRAKQPKSTTAAPITHNITALFAEMIDNGFALGTPVKVATKWRGYTDWHVKITKGRAECVMSFLVPEDVA